MTSAAGPVAFDFERDGVCVVPGVMAPKDCTSLAATAAELVNRRGGARVADVPVDFTPLIAQDGPLTAIAARLLGKAVQAVRMIAFDKSAARNWGLSWHQDRAIAVAARVEVPGYKNWTVKHGVHHVEAPAGVLEQMVAVRLHLDECGPDNGPLEVARGSYRRGRLSKSEVCAAIADMDCVPCVARTGDVVAMRGLTVHRSGPATVPTHCTWTTQPALCREALPGPAAGRLNDCQM